MSRVKPSFLLLLLALPSLAALGPSMCWPYYDFPGYRVVHLTAAPGPDCDADPDHCIEFRARRELLTAKPGTILQFPAGNWQFTDELIVPVSHVVLRGAGPQRTTLDFTGQQTGGQGILATEDGFVIQDLRVLNPKGDGVRVEGADGVVFQNVHVEWNTFPENLHGAYGLYPVQTKNVLIDNCMVRGSSDAGIYVGQSEHIIVRRSRAFENVAGIEIENSKDADVYLNLAKDNTGGILVFDNPGLPVYGCRASADPAQDDAACRGTRVFANWVLDNNHANFANGGTVALVPPGTGIIVMATDTIEIFSNVVRNHKTVNMTIISFLLTQVPLNDPNYDPWPQRVDVWENELADGNWEPEGDLGILASGIFAPDPLPDVTYENIYLRTQFGLDPVELDTDNTLKDSVEVCVNDNHDGAGGAATFGKLVGKFANLDGHACAHPRRDDTVLAPVSQPPVVTDPYTPEQIAELCDAGAPASAGVNWDAYVVDCPSLADYRLYQDPTEPRSAPNAGGTPFDLTTPLFSDYAQKDRIVYVPPNTQASYSESGVFQFPVGTIIAKTFTFSHDQRTPQVRGTDVVETRLLIHRADGWKGRAYIWNEDGSEALLALGGGSQSVEWIGSDGAPRVTQYQIPSTAQCSRCHVGNGDEPIGPKARLLNRDFDYGGGLVKNQLAHWSDLGILAGAPLDPAAAQRLPVWDDPDDGTLDERARAYLESNCMHCHNPAGRARFTGLYLEAARPLGGPVGVCKRPGSAGPGAGGLDYDIVPGDPEASVMIFRMASVAPQIKMPELAKSVVHDEGTQVVADWIASLEGSCPNPTGQ